MRLRHPSLVALCFALGLSLSCGGDAAAPSEPSLAEPLQVVADTIDLEYWAYAELLSVFSEDGARPLFDATVDWETHAGEPGDAYDRVFAVAEALAAAEPQLRAAISQLDASGGSFAVRAPSGIAVSSQALSLSDWFPSIFGAASGVPAKTRMTIVEVANFGGLDARRDLYELAQELASAGRLGSDRNVELGDSPDAFLAKLASGELDTKLSMHNLHKDATRELGASYGDAAIELKKRPNALAATVGAELLQKGGESYFDSATSLISGGLGQVGKAFKKGVDLSKSVVAKIMGAEMAAKDPVSFVKDLAREKIEARAGQFISDKTGLGSTEAGLVVAGIADNMQGFFQNVSAAAEVQRTELPVQETPFREGWAVGGLTIADAAQAQGTVLTWSDNLTGATKAMLLSPHHPEDSVVLLPAPVEVSVTTFDGSGEPKAKVQDVPVSQGVVSRIEAQSTEDEPGGLCDIGSDLCEATCVDLLPTAYLCDGEDDCGDGSDEVGCSSEPGSEGSTGCVNSFESECDNGNCIHEDWVCDGEDDCGDGSDETGCTSADTCAGMFVCDDMVCIDSSWQCDGAADCSNGEDENGC